MSANSQTKAAQSRRTEAALWATDLQQGMLTDDERSKFEAWHADAENQRALAEAQQVWRAMRAVLIAQEQVSAPAPKVRRRVIAVQVAAAVSGLAAVGTLVVTRDSWWPQQVPPVPQVAQVSQVQVLETQTEPLSDGELWDGTAVYLRPGTRMRFEISDAQRLAQVSYGEIFFDVAKDPQRPFIVDVGDGKITAVGTQFAVRRYDGPSLVIVQEGTVKVERTDSDENIPVNAGERLEILRSGDLIARQANVKEELKWARKLVNFSGKTIGEVAQAFNRHNKLQIQIDDAEVASEVLSLGEYFLDDPQFFVVSLEVQGKVTVERIDAETVRLSSGSGTGKGG